MYKRSREYMSCNIAGQSHWDIAEVFGELKPGSKLKLKAEPDTTRSPCTTRA